MVAHGIVGSGTITDRSRIRWPAGARDLAVGLAGRVGRTEAARSAGDVGIYVMRSASVCTNCLPCGKKIPLSPPFSKGEADLRTSFLRLFRLLCGQPQAGGGVSADFAGGAGDPLRLCRKGKPELTEATRLCATAAEGIPEGFRSAEPRRVAPGGVEARAPPPAWQNTHEIPKSLLKEGWIICGSCCLR